MSSSLQGGRKEKALVGRKEARFNKALLSLEKGKQAAKHGIPLHGCAYTGFLVGVPLISAKTMEKKKNY